MDQLPELDEAVQRLRKHIGHAAEDRQLNWFFSEDLVNQRGRLFIAAWRAIENSRLDSPRYPLPSSTSRAELLHALAL